MDNERPIEKLLRRYVKKRRDEAGAPLELHPATRRLLQGEVARQFQKERNEQTISAESSVRWWPRLAYGLCAFAIVAVMAAILLPALTKSKSRPLEMARSDKQEAASTFGQEKEQVAPLEVAKNEVPASPARNEQKLVEAADNFGTVITNSAMLAFTDMPKSAASRDAHESRVTPGAMAISGTVAASSPPVLDREAANEPAIAEAPVTLALAKKADDEGGKYKLGDEVRRGYYAQTQMAGRFLNADKSGSKTYVLASFQVEQNGNDLRVIDSDGSVYAGVIQSTTGQTADEVDSLKRKNKEESPARQITTGKDFDSASNRDAFIQNNFFRVSGTNKTLKQQVIFTGNFVTITNASQSQNLPGQRITPLLFNNSIIVGRAQLEKDKEIEVNATPVSQ